ncbi:MULTISPECIES: sensor histidine kinase [Aeromicrobium]|uniref:Sensor histidine kinase n=1 Tax=Aeromicrobium yanjiei TaxID=2662028 RepID=A0A5Q2MGK2_9ACTN|nr:MULTISPECIES: histidine kinase [Aeromicrobium]MRK02570.1 sensor histidine kinase [Aeromicrobium sp. S22]QGG40176.1 sensor histidine kinase [Aeromicrobium yanjiei]
MDNLLTAILAVIALVAIASFARWWLLSRRPSLGTPEDRATYETLHTTALAAPALRRGLDAESASSTLPHLRTLLGTRTVAITDTVGPLAWDGPGGLDDVADLMSAAIGSGTTQASGSAIVAPLAVEGQVVGSVVVMSEDASAGLARATTEIARWMSSQLELAELATSRTALMEAELRALRAQISPHFIYNSLGAIASFVRTDPERARELLLEFADFTRYSFRQHGEFTTLAEELRSIERYLVLEKARFGDRLRIVTLVAPEVLSVTLPFLSVQPLVENAVRHGLERKAGDGTITVTAHDAGTECLITIEDDGAGVDPEIVRAALSGRNPSASVGLANVDERMRTVYGNAYGIVVETAPGFGTKVSLRVPKFSPAVGPAA